MVESASAASVRGVVLDSESATPASGFVLDSESATPGATTAPGRSESPRRDLSPSGRLELPSSSGRNLQGSSSSARSRLASVTVSEGAVSEGAVSEGAVSEGAGAGAGAGAEGGSWVWFSVSREGLDGGEGVARSRSVSSSSRQGIGPFIKGMRYTGRRPRCVAAGVSAARIAARQPPHRATSQSPRRRNNALARGSGRRSPYGGFVSTRPAAAAGRTSSKCRCSIAIDPATPAAAAQACAASTARGSRSLAAHWPAG